MRGLDASRLHRILIRGTNWIGDAVMSIPAMRELRRIFPHAHITLLVRPWVSGVYGNVDFVDEILLFDKTGGQRGPAGLLRMSAELRRRNFDAAFLFQNAFEAALLATLARIPIRIGYRRDGRGLLLTHGLRIDPAVREAHQAYYYLGIVSGLGLAPDRLRQPDASSLDVRVGTRPEGKQKARETLARHGIAPGTPLIGVNPGAAYGPAKRWLAERYARAADLLAARHRARTLVFGSAGEGKIAGEVAGAMASSPVVLAGLTTLEELMALLCECAVLITNDSGPMHLAAALGVPQVAIFGSTSEKATGPLSPRARVVREPVECSPCFLRSCPTDFRCMTRITVDRVVGEAEKLMAARHGSHPPAS